MRSATRATAALCASLLACLGLFLGLPRVFAAGAAVEVGRVGHGPLVDALGDTLPAGPYPQRIISLSPSVTEILFALGIDPERIVGVTRYCDNPPEARNRPEIGGIVDPSLERIQMSRPDLVLAVRGNPREVQERIRALEIPLFAVDDRTGLEGVVEIIGQLIALTGPPNALPGRDLLPRLSEGLTSYRAWSDTLPEAQRPTVYYIDPENRDWTAGPGSHIDDLIRLAGGRNIVREGGAWPQYSVERLLLEQPDWLLVALPDGVSRSAVKEHLKQLPGWNRLRALQADHLCIVDAGPLLRPGPRLFPILDIVAACVQAGAERPRVAWPPEANDRQAHPARGAER